MRRSVSLALVVGVLIASAPPVSAQLSTPLDSATMAGFRWRSIGPANMGGRATDVEGIGFPSKTFYIATAAGGIWKTVNNGTTFFPLFTNEKVVSMGDLAIAPSDTNIVWAGTGEEDPRNSISPGGGIYKSADGGLTWTLMGLEKTESIGRIIVHPTNPNIVYVAAAGATWRTNPERGLYKTTDGGRTWVLSKFISEKAGFIDLAMDPRDPNVLWASSWERQRGPYFLKSGGPGSALWKTTDGGASWAEIKGGGFPASMKGRINIALAMSNPDIMYTVLEADTQPNARPAANSARQQVSGLYRSADAGRTWTYMSNRNTRPFYYSQVRVDPKNPDRVYWTSTPMAFSDDGGKTTRSTLNTVHVDDHGMWIDPNDPAHIVVVHDGGASQSWDRGGTWEDLRTMAIGQFYAVSYDMAVPYNICGGAQDNGSWCGPSRKRRGPIVYADWNHVGGGDGFVTAQDPRDPNVIYTESQGGSMQRRDLRTGEQASIRPAGFNRQRFQGEITAIWPDTTKPATVEQARQIAEIRTRMAADSVAYPALRWNWNTPFFLSPHNPSIFYTAANRVYKSVNRGDNLRAISPDLSSQDVNRIRISTGRNADGTPARDATGGITNDATGAETHGTIVSLNESPVRPGLLYAGTDDGNVWLTRNDGGTWENISGRFAGVPAKTWVSHVEPSRFDSGTVYVTFDNHQEGDFTPYVFMSSDFGRTFRSISSNIPKDRPNFVHVIAEDPVNRNLLYVGTDVGVYVTLDRGVTWQPFMNGMPTVPVHDLKVHPRDRELIAGTHGRSFLVVSVAPLQQLADSVMRKSAHLFASPTAYMYSQPITGGLSTNLNGDRYFEGTNAPYGAEIAYRLGSRANTPVTIVITDIKGDTVTRMTGPSTPGLHRVTWGFTRGPVVTFADRGGGGGGGGAPGGGAPGGGPPGGGGGPPSGAGGPGGGGAAQPTNYPGFPAGYNPRPAEGPVVPGASPSAPQTPGQGGRGGGGGGGGRGGFGGPAPAPIVTGDYLVTLDVGGQKSSHVLRVVDVGGSGTWNWVVDPLIQR